MLSFFITFLVISILLFAGPAEAFNLDIQLSDTSPIKGDKIYFSTKLDIDSDERLPIDFFMLELIGPQNVSCRFSPQGTPISGCSLLDVDSLSSAISSYGNLSGNYSSIHHDFGYGYGYSAQQLSFNLSMNTSGLLGGDYKTYFRVKIGSEFFSKEGSDFTLIDPNMPTEKLIVYSPTNNGLFGEKRVQFNITAGVQADEIEYIVWNEDHPKYRRLCKDCSEYGYFKEKSKIFDEGQSNITIRAVYPSGTTFAKYISLFVDSKDPRITRTLPNNHKIVNGSFFQLNFIEDNPINVFLTFGNSLLGFFDTQLNLVDCSDGTRRTSCNTSEDLDFFDGQEIEYYFNLTDIIGRTDKSRKKEITIDTSPPLINSFNYTINRRRMDLNINITEKNFDKALLMDLKYSSIRARLLCSTLRGELCKKKISLKSGDHELFFIFLDEAGNSNYKALNVTI